MVLDIKAIDVANLVCIQSFYFSKISFLFLILDFFSSCDVAQYSLDCCVIKSIVDWMEA